MPNGSAVPRCLPLTISGDKLITAFGRFDSSCLRFSTVSVFFSAAMVIPVISRDEFLLTVGLSSAALITYYLTDQLARNRNLKQLASARRLQRDAEISQLRQELLTLNTKQFEDSRSYILSLPVDKLLGKSFISSSFNHSLFYYHLQMIWQRRN